MKLRLFPIGSAFLTSSAGVACRRMTLIRSGTRR
jgi:hypothetical protein